MASSSQPNKQADDLLAAQKLLRATLDSSMDMIQVFEAVRNQQGQIVDFTWILNNHAAEKIYGDVVGKSLLQHQPGVVEEGIFEAFKHAVETGQPQQYEKHYVHEQFDGWFHQSVVRLNDGVATTTTDITSRKKAEQQLRESKTLLQDVIDAPRIGMAVYRAVRNDEGDIVDFLHEYINRASIQMLGGEDFTGRLFTAHGDNAVVQLPQFIDVICSGQANGYVREAQFRGRKVWFAITNTSLGEDRLVHTWEDVTERKQAEAEILRLNDEIARKATDKYYTIFNSIDAGFVIHEMIRDESGRSIDFRLMEVNPTFTRQTGLGTDTVGMRASEFLHNLEQFWIDTFDRVARSGIPEQVEDYNQATNRWYNVHISRVGGQDRQVAVLFEDMTERKQRETGRELLMNIAQDLGQLTDEAQIIRSVGTRLAAHLGITCYHYVDIDEDRDQVTVRHFWHANEVPPLLGTHPLRAFVSPAALTAWRAGMPTIINDIEREVPDGTPEAAVLKAGAAAQQISAFIATGLSHEGKWKAYFAIADSRPREWTAVEIELVQEVAGQLLPRIERVRAEEALRQSQKRFESIANLVPDLLWDSQPDGSTNWYNQRWLEYTGQRLEEAIGYGWTDAIHPDDRDGSAQRYAQAVAASTSLRQEHRIRRHDGSYRWFAVNATPLKDETGQVVSMYGAATDIHESKRLEATLRETDRRKDEFLAMLAHELRNPMATLRSGLTLLDLTTTDETTRPTVAMMERQIDHLVRMVDDLLDVGRISRGKIELHKERVNFVELVQQAVASCQPLFAQGKKLHLQVPPAPIELDGDATRLTQIVTNLLTNSARYTGEQGQIWLSLEHNAGRPDHPEAILRVRDNGIGIAADHLSAIFELFVQVDNSTARSRGGWAWA
ncbi:PAS domain S-box protein [Spirosoma rhododendri]|uniref:histidine kinase n=1 Tax=Spirosoma rhododendri TaxID=2728024 RepID=A0A7L5DGN7_9BACT|nr:PAS domain S-box protein [Spirosoma rhododendri]QJD77359.1 PAS domain S-box protein [Spirosoma rhododendri]